MGVSKSESIGMTNGLTNFNCLRRLVAPQERPPDSDEPERRVHRRRGSFPLQTCFFIYWMVQQILIYKFDIQQLLVLSFKPQLTNFHESLDAEDQQAILY